MPQIPIPDLTTILLIIAALVLLWLLLRFLFKLAIKVFACGCAVIAAIAAILLLLAYAGH
ncbi:MAG: hypothetical protein D6755_12925 [Anaerolineae bacterium]|nr:MAG: hypothetical protein D6755_12925 [Anaerolineae bacterium]